MLFAGALVDDDVGLEAIAHPLTLKGFNLCKDAAKSEVSDEWERRKQCGHAELEWKTLVGLNQ